MTNLEIIETAKMLNGVTEEAHTFAHWRTLGYSVRKGEHAAFSAVIWKYASKRKASAKVESDEEQPTEGRMFMKKAYFFTASQVDALALA